jgi:hypothetical protein
MEVNLSSWFLMEGSNVVKVTTISMEPPVRDSPPFLREFALLLFGRILDRFVQRYA